MLRLWVARLNGSAGIFPYGIRDRCAGRARCVSRVSIWLQLALSGLDHVIAIMAFIDAARAGLLGARTQLLATYQHRVR